MDYTIEQMFPRQVAKFRAKGQVEALFGIARDRFGKTPRALEKQLRAVSLEDFDGRLERLLRVSSIDEAINGSGSLGNRTPARGISEVTESLPPARQAASWTGVPAAVGNRQCAEVALA